MADNIEYIPSQKIKCNGYDVKIKQVIFKGKKTTGFLDYYMPVSALRAVWHNRVSCGNPSIVIRIPFKFHCCLYQSFNSQ